MIITLQVPAGTINLKVKDFDEDELDIDRLLQTDYKRIGAETVTFPVILNRLGIIMADANNKLAERKLDLEIYMAKMREEVRVKVVNEALLSKDKKPTADDIKYKVEYIIKTSPEFKVKNVLLSKAQKEYDYISSIYWAAKDKSDKLNKLSDKIRSDDMLDLTGSINGIKINMIRD